MIELQGNATKFIVEFRHRRKAGKRPEFYARSPVEAVTSCCVISEETRFPFIAIGTAICIKPDKFSRKMGRMFAFYDAIEKCGLLKEHREDLIRSFLARFGKPSPLPRLSKSTSIKITEEQKQAFIQAGIEKRNARQKQLSSSGEL